MASFHYLCDPKRTLQWETWSSHQQNERRAVMTKRLYVITLPFKRFENCDSALRTEVAAGAY